MADSSFDVVSKVDRQEVDNALNQAAKELATRFDFRGTDTSIAWKGDDAVEITSSTEERLKAAVDVFKEKLVRRGVSVKNVEVSTPAPEAGGMVRQTLKLQIGVPKETAKEIVKLIKQTKINVQGAIQEDHVRVTGKKRDDLQKVIHGVKEADLGYELSFVNMRE